MRDPLSQRVTITLSSTLINQIDRLVQRDLSNRSNVIRLALIKHINDPQNMIVANPQSVALDKMYNSIKDEYPNLDPCDGALIKFLFDEKMQKRL